MVHGAKFLFDGKEPPCGTSGLAHRLSKDRDPEFTVGHLRWGMRVDEELLHSTPNIGGFSLDVCCIISASYSIETS